MSRRRFRSIASAGASSSLAACVLTGCMVRTETFDIDVHNATAQPVTITLTKDAGPGRIPGPYELNWASPEEVAMGPAGNREQWEREDKQVVPPGRSASVHHLSGQFNSHSRAVVRCFLGNLKLDDVLARSKGNPDRLDVPLSPGRNDITVVDRDGRLAAEVEQGAERK